MTNSDLNLPGKLKLYIYNSQDKFQELFFKMNKNPEGPCT